MNQINIDYVDTIRNYWITDPMTRWACREDKLDVDVRRNCILSPTGEIKESNINKGTLKGIYVGHLLSIWGHCITDNFRKLWFLKSAQCKQLKENGFLIYYTLHQHTNHLSDNYKELLQYLDIDASEFNQIDEDTNFEVLYVPGDSMDDEHHFYREYKDLIDTIYNRIPYSDNTPKKVYFSRSRWNNGRDFGEKYIETVFQKMGYTIIYPEQMPLKEQLSILRSCDSFAATEGSVSHNMLFVKENAECIVIRKTRSCNGYQRTANSIRSFSIAYVESHLSIFNVFDNGFGPFFMYVNDNLVQYAKSKGFSVKKSFPFRTFLNYLMHVVWYAARYRQKILLIGDFDFYWKRLKSDFLS